MIIYFIIESWSSKKKEPNAATDQIPIQTKTLVKKNRTATNLEDTTTCCDKFHIVLQYTYFRDTSDENNDIETCNISFVICDFSYINR